MADLFKQILSGLLTKVTPESAVVILLMLISIIALVWLFRKQAEDHMREVERLCLSNERDNKIIFASGIELDRNEYRLNSFSFPLPPSEIRYISYCPYHHTSNYCPPYSIHTKTGNTR